MTSGINGIDNRRVIRATTVDPISGLVSPNPEFSKEPLPAVTAIDTKFGVAGGSVSGFASGIVVAPNYVLTAGHSVYAPTTTSKLPIALRESEKKWGRFQSRQIFSSRS